LRQLKLALGADTIDKSYVVWAGAIERSNVRYLPVRHRHRGTRTGQFDDIPDGQPRPPVVEYRLTHAANHTTKTVCRRAKRIRTTSRR
jgi:hypothetical protein